MSAIVVESILARELGITFIDARTIVTEAKLNLGILGYPTPEEKALLVEEAMRIYDEYPGLERFEMICNRHSLDRAIREQPQGPSATSRFSPSSHQRGGTNSDGVDSEADTSSAPSSSSRLTRVSSNNSPAAAADQSSPLSPTSSMKRRRERKKRVALLFGTGM